VVKKRGHLMDAIRSCVESALPLCLVAPAAAAAPFERQHESEDNPFHEVRER
jgi:hypothetical protein